MSADIDDDSRLGHDPLAWLEEDDEAEAKPQAEEVTAASEPSAQAVPEQSEPNTTAPKQSDNNATFNLSKFSVKQGQATLFLPERLVVQHVEKLHKEWQQITKQEGFDSIYINADQVEDIDAAGLQLLYAVTTHFLAKQYSVVLQDIPDNLANAFAMCGLAEHFEAMTDVA